VALGDPAIEGIRVPGHEVPNVLAVGRFRLVRRLVLVEQPPQELALRVIERAPHCCCRDRKAIASFAQASQ
jgi:hypothetical protein